MGWGCVDGWAECRWYAGPLDARLGPCSSPRWNGFWGLLVVGRYKTRQGLSEEINHRSEGGSDLLQNFVRLGTNTQLGDWNYSYESEKSLRYRLVVTAIARSSRGR